MSDAGFPRTTVGGVSLSRMIIGTNWILGFSHTSSAADALIARTARSPGAIADIAGGTYPAVINILLALLQRQRTGHGTYLDISMADNLFCDR